ncbi:MAG: cupin domain-containing protein [Candidatus Eremiobacteraeota bacterium]|nr:cupin domain-containing protein [Candidatus Eremiobacteraeota bacterium]MCW5868661.1 cupin domain-containing protein [Candidatus Eremiobacteraeota bacterium]
MKFKQSDLFGGQGLVEIEDLFQQQPLAPFREALFCRLEPGGRVGAHRQEHYAELVLIASGQGTALVQGEQRALMPGSLIRLPLGHSLELHNDGSEWLSYFIIKA